MEEKKKYSWAAIFDRLKEMYPEGEIVLVESKRKFQDPYTRKSLSGKAHMHARYEPETDSVLLWAFTERTEDVHDENDGSWGFWTTKEKVIGAKNRQGEWTEPLHSVWIPD